MNPPEIISVNEIFKILTYTCTYALAYYFSIVERKNIMA